MNSYAIYRITENAARSVVDDIGNPVFNFYPGHRLYESSYWHLLNDGAIYRSPMTAVHYRDQP